MQFGQVIDRRAVVCSDNVHDDDNYDDDRAGHHHDDNVAGRMARGPQ
ncbi:MAG TPA: hypothetical protein VHI95_03190 [Acidimicrobiales bacterium]|nr:hypothetical protein [Acidimicrobiales bacterium]